MMSCFLNICAEGDRREDALNDRTRIRIYEQLNENLLDDTEGPPLYVKDEEITRLSRQNASLTRRLADIECELAEKTTKYSYCKEQAAALQMEIEKLRNNHDDGNELELHIECEAKLAALTKQKDALSTQTLQRSELFEIEIAELKQTQIAMTDEAQRVLLQNDELKLQIAALKQSISDIESNRVQLLSDLEESKAVKMENDALSSRTADQEAHIRSLSETIRETECVLDESAKIKSVDQEHAASTALSERVRSLIALHKETETELERKGEEMEKLNTKYDAQSTRLLRSEERVESDSVLVHSLTMERDEILLRFTESEGQIDEHRQRANRLNRRLLELQSKSVEQEQSAKVMERANHSQSAKIEELSAEIAAMAATTKTLQQTLESAVMALSKNGTEIVAKEELNAALRKENESLLSRIESLSEQIVEIRAESSRQSERRESVEDTNRCQLQQIDALRANIETLTAAEQTARQRLESTTDALTKSNLELVSLREQSERMKLENDSLNQRALSGKEEAEALRSKHSATAMEFEAFKESAESDVGPLRDENVRLKAEIAFLKESNVDLVENAEKLTGKLSESKRFQKRLSAQFGAIDFEAAAGIDFEEEKETSISKKTKITSTATQIRIAVSEDAKTRSLLLCSRPRTVNRGGHHKEFGFLKFCRSHLSDKAVNQLFSKFKKHSIDAAQLMSILTLTVIIYNVRLHQYQYGGSSKPKMDSKRIKKAVEHLAVYIVRRFGQRNEDKEAVAVRDDDGQLIEGTFYGFSCAVTKKRYSKDLVEWIESYLADDGEIEIHALED